MPGVRDTARAFESVKISSRTYFSSYHLWAAKEFSENARNIEGSFSGNPKFDIRHRAFVTNSILSSVAFAEAAINEVFQDAADGHSSYISKLPENQIEILSDYWNMTEMKNKSHISTLDKYQLALRFCGVPPFDTGQNPYQDAYTLIRLRNALVHYKPESISVDDPHRLSKQLVSKFPENKLMGNSRNPFFPDRCLGYGCTKWASSAIEDFTDSFFDAIGIIPNYRVVDSLATDS